MARRWGAWAGASCADKEAVNAMMSMLRAKLDDDDCAIIDNPNDEAMAARAAALRRAAERRRQHEEDERAGRAFASGNLYLDLALLHMVSLGIPPIQYRPPPHLQWTCIENLNASFKCVFQCPASNLIFVFSLLQTHLLLP